ncbi:MAG TPA: class II aldolase/adducin family protein [Pseudomonadales bacterium]
MAVTSRSLVARTPPTFESKATERTHRLQRLAAACRIFGRYGFGDGVLGHVTVRDPEHADRLWMNPYGVSMRQMTVSKLVQVDHRGDVVAGNGAINPVGVRLHSAVHRARPDVVAMCHAHSLYGSTWSSLGRVLDPVTQDACLFFERQALIVEPRLTLDADSADQFAAAFGDKRVAIQSGHGLFTTGYSVDEAAWWFVLMDRCCQTQLLAEAAGTPNLWPADRARDLANRLGTPGWGWMSFQTLWDELIASEPDLVG